MYMIMSGSYNRIRLYRVCTKRSLVAGVTDKSKKRQPSLPAWFRQQGLYAMTDRCRRPDAC